MGYITIKKLQVIIWAIIIWIFNKYYTYNTNINIIDNFFNLDNLNLFICQKTRIYLFYILGEC